MAGGGNVMPSGQDNKDSTDLVQVIILILGSIGFGFGTGSFGIGLGVFFISLFVGGVIEVGCDNIAKAIRESKK